MPTLEPDWITTLEPDRNSPLTLARQLYLGLYEAIASGRLPGGETLPASRVMAARLGLSRNTVVAAISQLAEEQLVSCDGRRGTVVVERAAPSRQSVDAAMTAPPGNQAPALSARSAALNVVEPAHRDLASGEPDASLFPAVRWQRALARAARLPADELGYGSNVTARLQDAIARHLAVYRSLVVDPARIVVTSSTRQSLMLAAALYTDPGDIAWLETPGYPGAVDAFRASGLELQACPVDESGARPTSSLPERNSQASRRSAHGRSPRLVYLTPCFQYPLGMPLSVSRRDAFLALSARQGAVLFEDDYDSDFRDDMQPRPALAATAAGQGAPGSPGSPGASVVCDARSGHGACHGKAAGDSGAPCVLHAGTFSKLVFPAARVAWLVVPDSHAAQARSMLRALGGSHGTVMQAAILDLLESGVIARHLQRARQIYARRRVVLREQLQTSAALGLAGGGGLSAVLELAEARPLCLLARAIEDAGLGAVPLERFEWDRPLPEWCRHLVIGLGSSNLLTLPDSLKRLEKAVESVIARA